MRIFGDILRQELERDEAFKPHIPGLEHYTHPTPADLVDDTVVRDGLVHGASPLLKVQKERNTHRCAYMFIRARYHETAAIIRALTGTLCHRFRAHAGHDPLLKIWAEKILGISELVNV